MKYFYSTLAFLLLFVTPVAAEGLPDGALPVRRLSRHPQLPGVRRRRHPRLRHRQRATSSSSASRRRTARRRSRTTSRASAPAPPPKRLYFTTPKKLYCLDLVTEKTLWEKALPQGCDRMSITPDGKVLYVPSFEKDTWNVVDGATGDVVATIETKSGAHNTVVSLDGTRMYLAGLKSPLLSVADTKTHKVVGTVGPFAASIRPFTVNGAQTLVLRQRQRAARLRDRRPEDRQDAAPRRGAGLQEGHGQAARLPQPRHRPDAGREGSLGRATPPTAACTSSTTRSMPPKQIDEHRRARAARLGHVQPRRPLRLPLDRRGDRRRRRRRSSPR